MGASLKEFEDLDYLVMGCAYSIQNELGRLCDENIYQKDLVTRLVSAGLGDIYTEVPLRVTYNDFCKTYYLDLVIEGIGLYELKAVMALTGAHDAQLINYLHLLGLSYGKLINFGAPKVEGKLIRAGIQGNGPRSFEEDLSGWRSLSPCCRQLRDVFRELLSDWESRLSVSLYEEALTYFLGGEDDVVKRLSITRDEVDLGSQSFRIHTPGIAFQVSAVRKNHQNMEFHLRRLLLHTDLDAIQWLNISNDSVRYYTVSR